MIKRVVVRKNRKRKAIILAMEKLAVAMSKRLQVLMHGDKRIIGMMKRYEALNRSLSISRHQSRQIPGSRRSAL